MLLLCALSLAATHLVLVRSMQRLPTILAIAAGLFISLCVFEAMAHGINPTLEWDLHPPWWQSDVLAHIGWVFAVPSVLLLRFVSFETPWLFRFSLLLTIVAVSAIVFFVARGLLRIRRI